jgi:hypothetical protein
MSDNETLESVGYLIRKYAILLLVDNESSENAFNILKKELQVVCGLSEKDAANILRVAVGLYLGEEKYCEGALKALTEVSA